MLPAKEIAVLSKQVILAVIRTTDPQCAELRKEFNVPYLNSWVVVLDGKGETLASWIGDAAGAGCRQSAVSQLPRKMAALIRRSLRIAESLQELERRWKKDPGNPATFDRYAERLQEMHAFARLQEICRVQAADHRLSEELRNEFRLREFLARAIGRGPELHTGKGRALFARDGEKLLVELAGHPKAAELPEALFVGAYAHVFDVPARSAEAIARLQQAARQHGNSLTLQTHIRQLARTRRDWINEMKGYLHKAEGSMQKQFIAASLGDARAAIELFSQPGYKDVPEYRERVRDAKRKLRTE